ncbi:ATP-binding cassette domain-containing protein, partial [Corallococcus exiguus]|nr:ATP-binding cassette domain-containing protein [Corallococcus exiguus]
RGRVLWQTPAGVPPRIAYVPQHVAILDASLHENVVFGMDGGRDGDVRAALAVAQLAGHDPAAGSLQLSGGERQRAAIARALVSAPSVLVCDEVTSALDVSVQAAVIELLREIQDETGMAMLFVTHNITLSRHIAHRLAVLQKGRIVDHGLTEDVLARPDSE